MLSFVLNVTLLSFSFAFIVYSLLGLFRRIAEFLFNLGLKFPGVIIIKFLLEKINGQSTRGVMRLHIFILILEIDC